MRRSFPIFLIPCVVEDQFRSLAEAYLQDGLVRGVPSLFADVKALYSDTSKRDVIGQIVLGFSSRLGEVLAGPSRSNG